MVNGFPPPHFESGGVFESKMSLLQTEIISMVLLFFFKILFIYLTEITSRQRGRQRERRRRQAPC